MDYRFEISLPKKSDFKCEIAIEGEQTFQQFHDKIVEALHYDSSQMASFFMIDKMGDRVKEIALMEMDLNEGEEREEEEREEEEGGKPLVMDCTKISDVIKPGCLELEYVFDFFSNRFFRVEFAGEYHRKLSDVLPLCISCEGSIPEQFSFDEAGADWGIGSIDGRDDEEYDDSFLDEFDSGSFEDEDFGDGEYYGDDEYGGRRYESLDDYIDKI